MIGFFLHSCIVTAAGALLFGCTVALCFLTRDLMFYVIGESIVPCWTSISRAVFNSVTVVKKVKTNCLMYLQTQTLNLHFYVFIPTPFISLFHVSGGITVSIIAFVFTIKFLCELAARVVSFLQNEDPGRRGDRSIYDYVRGNYLDPRSCKVSWDWKEPQEVGQTMSFRVQVKN